MPTTEFRFRPHPDVVSTALDNGERVLLDLASMRYYSLNETGALIWSVLQNESNPAAIAARVAERFVVEPEDAERYVAAFLDKLAEDGLVDRLPS